MAEVARRARRQAEKVNDGFGARLHVALQRRPRTYRATPRIADAAAINALDTHASPTNASYRRYLWKRNYGSPRQIWEPWDKSLALLLSPAMLPFWLERSRS